ncbi:MAG: NERD domain-containing protein, partial [Cyanobacteriota bacterium]
MGTKTSSHCQFITTEPLEKSGEIGEHYVWDAVRDAFAQRECIGYWRYPIFSKVGKFRKEPDILIADSELGLIVIEIKSVTIDQIVAIVGHRWEFQNYYITSSNPYEQAENQLFALLGYCDREPSLRRHVSGRALVCLPLITEDQWYKSGFYQLPSCPPILFQNHLRFLPSICDSLIQQLQQTSPIIKGSHLTEKQWKLLQAVISGTPVFRTRVGARYAMPPQQSGKTRASVLTQVRQHLFDFDLQQEHIAKTIPPGPQRIRGIAGSGKTVLLCQKAAHMHLKHPDWDIAFVFFSRSLYHQIIAQLDQWLLRFSSGEVGYDPKQGKLQVLH